MRGLPNNKCLLSVTLLGSLLLAASSASALTVYEGKGITYKLGGDFQIQYRQKAGKNKDLYVDYDDAELKNTVIYSFDDNLSAFGQLDYDFKKDKIEEIYVGLEFDSFSFLIGETDFASEAFGVERQIEGSSFEDAFPEDAGDDQIQLRVKFNEGNLLLSHDAEVDGDDESIDIGYYGKTGDLSYHAAYQSYKETPSAKGLDTVGIAFSYNFGKVLAGVAYSENDNLEVLHISTGLKLPGSNTINAGYEIAEENGDDIDSWYLNITHKLRQSKYVSLFAEVHNTDESDSDAGYLAGIRVKF